VPHLDSLPDPLRSIHIMGIAGTAMGSLAGMLKDAGYDITGSDKAVYPPMSHYLERLQIPVMEGFNASNLDHQPDLVIVGNVIRAVYEEAQALLGSDLPYCSFPEAFGALFLRRAHSVVVSGTHGKTTTTSVAAWLLEAAGRDPGFLIGGIAKNFDRTARAGGGEVFVIEGDEYDTAFFDKGPKFLHYQPRTCILTSVEFDHADIYTDLDHVKQSFLKLMSILPADGVVIARWDDPGARSVAETATCPVWTYGPGQEWDGEIVSVDTQAGTMDFQLLRHGETLGTYTTSLIGTHNLYNQVAAAAAAIHYGVTPLELAHGFSTFAGIKRRQEIIGEPGSVTVLDDFAHHPTAVRLTLAALRERFGTRRLWAIWEPRSATSRRNTFQKEYAEAFDAADIAVIAAPYDTSRIDEDQRFSSTQLVEDLTGRGIDAFVLDDAAQIAQTVGLRAHPHDVIAILSNGAFGGVHAKLIEVLDSRFETPG
jgi:UDP-N-acetylmuramate: L-alanyl-gamma-D-glutamyl-meso-diaminopimelate ligase